MGRKAQWEKNLVGPYTIIRRLKGATAKVGRVYAAVRRANGRPALLVAPSTAEHFRPREAWRLRLRASAKPAYLALEVEHAPGGAEPLAELAEGMDALTSALEAMERNPQAAVHLAAPPTPRRRARWQARAPYWAALGAAALAALLLVPRTFRAARTATPAAQEGGTTAAAEEALAAPEALPVASLPRSARLPGVGLDMPKRPFKGQHKPDDEGKCDAETEVAINGGCWIAVKWPQEVCKRRGYEWKGACYLPSFPAPREPNSTLPPRAPPAPAERAP